MNIACLGDAHGYLPPVPDDADIVVLAGDICPDGTLGEQREWCESRLALWLRAAGVPVVAVAGNHDKLFADSTGYPLGQPWTYLRDDGAEVRGVRFWGLPWTASKHDGGFDLREPGFPARASMIPAGVDVLVLHSPPWGFGDLMNHSAASCPANMGSLSVKLAVAEASPKLVLFGHCHDARGMWLWRDSMLVNCTSGWNGSSRGFNDGRGKKHSWKTIRWEAGQPRIADTASEDIRLMPGRYAYRRFLPRGVSERSMVLNEDGTVGEGSARCERQWRATVWDGRAVLVVSGELEDIMSLDRNGPAGWKGKWLNHERCDVELSRVA